MIKHFSVLLLFVLIRSVLWGQSCFNVNAGKDTTLPCTQVFIDLKAKIPALRSSEDYIPVSINYAPYPYTSPTGNELKNLYADDVFSNIINLPFTFCFYGSNYNQISIGSNGVFTFDVAANAGKEESYVLNYARPEFDTLPYAGGTADDKQTFYAPRASIFLGYYDMDPTPSQSPPERKIEWRLEGNAPCRKLVISYYHVAYYHGGNASSCTNLNCTMQAVLYEGTGLIDVFYERKPSCKSWYDGRAIAGLQNWDQDEYVALPNGKAGDKNGTVWTAINEGYRYIPNGTKPLLKRVELYKNNVLVTAGTTVDLGNGELEATFKDVFQVEDSMSYEVRAFYGACDNPLVETEGSDTIIIYKRMRPTATVLNACNTANGSIIIDSHAGPNIEVEYSLDRINWQPSWTFSLPPGTYTLYTRLVGTTCIGIVTATILYIPPFTMNGKVTHLTCNGIPTGEVSFEPLGPNGPYSYSNGGTVYQTKSVFLNLAAGTYIFKIKNSAGCIQDTTITITQPSAITNSVQQTAQASCSNNDGQVTITANGGTPGYSFSIDGGLSYQLSNIFTGLSIGTFNQIKIKDANGCIVAGKTVAVTLNDQMFLTLGADTTVCAGSAKVLQPKTNPQTDIFKWTPATGLNADNIKNPTAAPTDTIHYTLQASWGICNRTDDFWLNILRKPIVNAGNDTIVCYNTSAALNGSASNLSGTVNFKWTPNILLRTPNAPYTIARPDTTKTYTLTVTDNYGCNFSVSDDVLVQVRPEVIAFAGNDTIAVYGIPHQLSASGGSSYLWSPSSSLNNPFIRNPIATLYNDTYLSVLVKNDIGCSNTDDIFIKVYKGPTYYIPNAFTPNGDGLNDIFTPIPVGIKVTNYFNIYNRLGELVFHTTAWLKGWDGTYKGKKAAAGAYVWTIQGIDRDGKTITMKGSVILIE